MSDKKMLLRALFFFWTLPLFRFVFSTYFCDAVYFCILRCCLLLHSAMLFLVGTLPQLSFDFERHFVGQCSFQVARERTTRAFAFVFYFSVDIGIIGIVCLSLATRAAHHMAATAVAFGENSSHLDHRQIRDFHHVAHEVRETEIAFALCVILLEVSVAGSVFAAVIFQGTHYVGEFVRDFIIDTQHFVH